MKKSLVRRMAAAIALVLVISLPAVFPDPAQAGTDPFLGEIQMTSASFAPKGWALCHGQTLPINQNQALFSLLGTRYGGNGQTTFGLPNLQGRVPIGTGSHYVLGNDGAVGSETIQLPVHAHQVTASTAPSDYDAPGSGRVLGAVSADDRSEVNIYLNQAGNTYLAGATVSGGVAAPDTVSNMQPYQTISYIIALQGIFPSQN